MDIHGTEEIGQIWKTYAIRSRKQSFYFWTRQISLDIYLDSRSLRVCVVNQLKFWFPTDGELNNICFVFFRCCRQDKRPDISYGIFVKVRVPCDITDELSPCLSRDKCRGNINSSVV